MNVALNYILYSLKLKKNPGLFLQNYNNRQLSKITKHIQLIYKIIWLLKKKNVKLMKNIYLLRSVCLLYQTNNYSYINRKNSLTFYKKTQLTNITYIIQLFIFCIFVIKNKQLYLAKQQVIKNKNKLVTVLRSPLSDKKSREQFHLTIYKKLLNNNVRYNNTINYILLKTHNQSTALTQKYTISYC